VALGILFGALADARAETGRFATAEEIVGTWELIQYPEATRKRVNKIEPWPAPYH